MSKLRGGETNEGAKVNVKEKRLDGEVGRWKYYEVVEEEWVWMIRGPCDEAQSVRGCYNAKATRWW